MSRTAYRRANSGMLSCLGICAAGFAAGAGLAAVFHYFPGLYAALGGWVIVICILPFPVSIVLAGVRYGRLNRQRIAQLAPVCSRLGFRMVTAPADEAGAAFFAPLAAIEDPLTLQEGAKRLAWWATVESADKPERLFEHEYTRGSGKSTVLFAHTVLAFPLSHPGVARRFSNEPSTFAVARHAALLRGAPFPHRRPLHTLEGLRIKWAVDGDMEAASRFLTPLAQAELEPAPYGEWWYVGNGWICCVFNAKCDATSLPDFVAHARAVLLAGA